MWGDDDDAAGAPGSGAGSGSSAAISRAAQSAFAEWEAANQIAGRRLVAAHELMVECVAHPDCWADPGRPGFSVVDAGVMAASHLARMFPISTYKAESMLSFAADLHFRYPAILSAMLAGRMDETTARALAEQMSHVDESVLDQVQQEVVDDYLSAIAAGERPGIKAVRGRADELISARDRNAVRERLADAGRERGARIAKARDGMATLYALLHADEAAVLAEALDAKVATDRAAEQDAANRTTTDAAQPPAGADDQPGPDPAAGPDFDDETYSLDQRRADALMSLICGDAEPSDTAGPDATAHPGTDSHNTTDPGPAGATDGAASDPAPGAAAGTSSAGAAGRAATGTSVTLRPKVTVIAPSGSGRWADRARVEFARTGQAALQALLEMLASSDGASLEYLDPALGADDDKQAALRYRPSTALATRIRLRDGTCRHPGCAVPIQDCDLDHVVPFNHADPAKGGLTVEENLAGLCRKHHRFKTFNDWHYRLDPDGTLIITTPEGKMMLTRPDGPLAAYRREQARAESQAWERQQRRNPEPDRAAPAGGAGTGDHVEKSSWARREARKQARRDKQRAENAANRATNTAREATAKQQARDVYLSKQEPGLGLGFLPVRVATRPDIIDLPPHRDSRWWRNNRHRYKDNGSDLEKALRTALGDLLDPPPPF